MEFFMYVCVVDQWKPIIILRKRSKQLKTTEDSLLYSMG